MNGSVDRYHIGYVMGDHKAGDSCVGAGNVLSGGQVTVQDGAGATLAIGRLGPGTLMRGTESQPEVIPSAVNACSFGFEIRDLPDVPFYRIAVGDKDPLEYSRDELVAKNWNVGFVISWQSF
jgi:hypothetical protein